ncbi:hypothetical protein [Carboxylicivirga sp. RSCT41]|uniref:hypothetical protein n=1 Tax=Carboxylicivirga agarovorans TaxID=3417570 RepID=UPI003D341BC2
MRKHKFHPHINAGREGNVIFYVTDDQIRLRSYSRPRDPKTEAQLKNRELHRELNCISSQTKALRQFCFKAVPAYSNSHNAFIGLHKQFIRQAGLTEGKVFESIHWSTGNRAGAASIRVKRSNDKFTLHWHPGNMTAISDSKSKVIWVLRNKTQGFWR